MSDTVDQKPASKIDQAAERAYAEAAQQKPTAKSDTVKPAVVKAAVAAESVKAAPKTETAEKAPVKAKTKSATKKPAAKKAAVKKTAKRAAPAKRTAKKNVKAKESKTMATKTNTKTKTESKMADMASNVQDRAKSAYAKAGNVAGEMGTFTKGNMEAVVESGKILADGMQTMARESVEDVKSVFQQTTEDMRLVAAVKSPTELLKLQGEIARRNFNAVVQYGSKRTEANIKLANDAFAPIQNRISVAGEKISKAA